ncbi:hypothetical protein ACU3L3_14305 [Priestia endophytica]
MKSLFLNVEHEIKFSKIRSEMNEERRFNSHYLAVAFLMAGNIELEALIKPYFEGKVYKG